MSWDYAVTSVVRIVDADTLDLQIDLGFHLSATLRFRLAGVDAPELPTPAGRAARDYAIGWVQQHPRLRATTYKTDSFGRYLCEVYAVTGEAVEPHLAAALVAAGHAIWRHYR